MTWLDWLAAAAREGVSQTALINLEEAVLIPELEKRRIGQCVYRGLQGQQFPEDPQDAEDREKAPVVGRIVRERPGLCSGELIAAAAAEGVSKRRLYRIYRKGLAPGLRCEPEEASTPELPKPRMVWRLAAGAQEPAATPAEAKSPADAAARLRGYKPEKNGVSCDGGSPPDGPHPPNQFCWSQQLVELRRKEWGLVSFLWGSPSRTATVDDVCITVWGDEEKAGDALKSVLKRINQAFCEKGWPIQVRRKQGWLTLDCPE
jgi:hypothetical protein